MAAAVHRSTICPPRHRLTFRFTWRVRLIKLSIALVVVDRPRDRGGHAVWQPGVTSDVVRQIHTVFVMETFDFNYTVAIVVAVLVSLGRIVTLLFATLKTCVKEYYEFRAWFRSLQRESQAPPT